ncbi:MAG: 6,7-dimethyl-8-ribityllumazine synthase [Candidatus Alcyoniella australis]|nr:6,7-dimethyl-8-ribityllumazine synthase [Candidatus Alcyoniella australis]
MPRTIEGKIDAKGLKFGIIVSRFNSFITERLLEGALDALLRHGAADDDVTVVKVPGSFEIPGMARRLADTGRFNAVICLGAVIRGGTPHFDYVAAEVSKGLGQLTLNHEVPVAFGILTCDTIEQAIERAGSKAGNKGYDAALSAVETANLIRSL